MIHVQQRLSLDILIQSRERKLGAGSTYLVKDRDKSLQYHLVGSVMSDRTLDAKDSPVPC